MCGVSGGLAGGGFMKLLANEMKEFQWRRANVQIKFSMPLL
jgi:hypothetical protein